MQGAVNENMAGDSRDGSWGTVGASAYSRSPAEKGGDGDTRLVLSARVDSMSDSKNQKWTMYRDVPGE